MFATQRFPQLAYSNAGSHQQPSTRPVHHAAAASAQWKHHACRTQTATHTSASVTAHLTCWSGIAAKHNNAQANLQRPHHYIQGRLLCMTVKPKHAFLAAGKGVQRAGSPCIACCPGTLQLQVLHTRISKPRRLLHSQSPHGQHNELSPAIYPCDAHRAGHGLGQNYCCVDIKEGCSLGCLLSLP